MSLASGLDSLELFIPRENVYLADGSSREGDIAGTRMMDIAVSAAIIARY